MARFNIVTIPPGGQFFHEIAETLIYGLRRLGNEAEMRSDWESWKDGTNIVLGFHLAKPDSIPSGSIIYNFEQLGSAPLRTEHYELGRRCTVWDDSAGHVLQWAEHGVAAKHVELGYVPELTRIAQREQDVDVLFYGARNERRDRVMQALKQAGANVVQADDAFGEVRDGLIARAKIVLNVHFYETKVFEIARVSYLLANRKAVVTEGSSDEHDYAWLRGGILNVPYECLVTSCLKLLRDDIRRDQIRELGFAKFSQRGETEILKNALSCR